TVKESTDAEITSMVDVQIQQEIPAILSAPLLNVLAFVLRVSDLEKEVKELKQVDHSTALHASIRFEVPSAVQEYLRLSLGDALQKELQKNTKDLIQQHSLKHPIDLLEKDSQKTAKAEFDQKETLFQMTWENKSYLKHPTNQALYDALMESLVQQTKHVCSPNQKKRQQDDRDQDPPGRPDQGLKKIKTSKDVKPSKKPKSAGSSKDTTQSQPKSTAPTHDPEWNKGKSVDNEPAQDWLNDLGNAKKPPLTFDDLISTPINFSAFAMNRLKISKLTKANLVEPVYNLLKGTSKSCVELEYNIEEFYHALSDQLDWNNPKGNRYPYDLSNPLPLHESRGSLTIPADFFFNNNLEYLRGGSTDRKYTESITKTKAAKYDVEGIEDMVPKLWSPIKSALYHSLKTSRSDFQDKLKRKRLMHTEELYKFSNDILTSICNTLDQMLKNLKLGYNIAMERRKWTATD
ncbi:hypothetical protein Tco_1443927, partial [Tanacetum coccineum]